MTAPATTRASGEWEFHVADALHLPLEDKSVDLCLFSPPYMDARTYGIDAQRDCDEWIDWMLIVIREAMRVTCNVVICNCAGVTRDRCYWPGPEGLLYRAWKEGIQSYRPVYWHRVGIPGSGGDDWFRADVEYCLCFKHPGPLAWSDNTACGWPPKWGPGGEMSHRLGNGARVNQWGKNGSPRGMGNKDRDGKVENAARPSHVTTTIGARKVDENNRLERGNEKGAALAVPVLANPGNLIKTIVGGGAMGHDLAHESEAPYPVELCKFFIKSLCPPGGTVLDQFSGSGSTVHAAVELGRRGIGFDIRQSQVDLGTRRLNSVQGLFAPGYADSPP